MMTQASKFHVLFRKETLEKPLEFNSLDGKVDRRSHTGTYQIVDRVPRYIV